MKNKFFQRVPVVGVCRTLTLKISPFRWVRGKRLAAVFLIFIGLFSFGGITVMAKSVTIVGGGYGGLDDGGVSEEGRSERQRHPGRVGHHPDHRRRRGDLQHHQALLRLPRARRAGLDAELQRHLQAGHQVRQLAHRRRLLLPPLPALRDRRRLQHGRVVAQAQAGRGALRPRLLHHPGALRPQAVAPLLRRPRLRRQGPGLLRRRPAGRRTASSPTTRSSIPTPTSSTPACSPTSSRAMRRGAASSR